MTKYDVIIGRDFLQYQSFILDFKTMELVWGDLKLDMTTSRKVHSTVSPPDEVMPVDLTMITEEAIPNHLSDDQRSNLLDLLEANRPLFQGGIGLLPVPPHSVEAKDTFGL